MKRLSLLFMFSSMFLWVVELFLLDRDSCSHTPASASNWSRNELDSKNGIFKKLFWFWCILLIPVFTCGTVSLIELLCM